MPGESVLYVKHLDRMVRFYTQCFALSPVDCCEGEYCVLASKDWELSLVAMPEKVAATITINEPPTRRVDSPVKLAYRVPDIDGVRPLVIGAGGWIHPKARTWTFRGLLILDCLDPEGNVVQLRAPLDTGHGSEPGTTPVI